MACVVSMCSWRRVYPRQVQHAKQAVRADAGDNGRPAEGQRETVRGHLQLRVQEWP